MEIDARQWMRWGMGALALLALLSWAFWPRAESVETIEVTSGPLIVTLDEEGETRVRERFTVSAPVDGRLLRIELEPGDPVIAGETVLAVFQPRDATPLDSRTRAERENEVRSLEAAFEETKHHQARARAELEFAKRDCDRARRLAALRVLSKEGLESAELSETRSLEAVEAANQAVISARYRLASARARLMNAGDPTRQGGDPIKIYAPIHGSVLARHHESETVVTAGEPLVDVGDTSELEIIADYLSRDAVKIRPGTRAMIERWGGAKPLVARVRRIEPSGFTKISALGVEEQRVNVVLDLETPIAERPGLGDGYRVETRIVVTECEDVIQVDPGVLFRNGEGWAVFAVEGGRAALRSVEVGSRTPDAAEIVSGIASGDRVIVHPGNAVSDGTRVTETGRDGRAG